jgi:asparagine synthase (glutamine-hydrolysing)
MEARLGTVMQDTLSDFCDRTDILDKTAVLNLVRKQRDPRSWYLFNLALWWNHYMV